jgi:hypothetical protein
VLRGGDPEQPLAALQTLPQEPANVSGEEAIVVPIKLDHVLFRLQPVEKLCAG